VEQSKRREHKAEDDRVFIFPTLQMNVINYREDEDSLLRLLTHFAFGGLSRFKLATGYFNLQQEITDRLNQNAGLKTEILTSSPRANGFYKAGRFKKYIPGMYRANELAVLQANKEQKNVSIHEYEKDGWTFHAKGAWIYEKNPDGTNPVGPAMTVIGSSNYSYRSNRRDTELQLYLVSEGKDFKQRMHEECDHLFKQSTKMTIDTVKNDGRDKLTFTERLLNRILKILL